MYVVTSDVRSHHLAELSPLWKLASDICVLRREQLLMTKRPLQQCVARGGVILFIVEMKCQRVYGVQMIKYSYILCGIGNRA